MEPVFPINVILNLTEGKKFYRYTYNEYTTTYGETHRSELNKNFHVTLKRLEEERFEYHIEIFDRVHRDKELSLSEKDFLDQIAAINNDVVLIADVYGRLKNIKGLPLLQNKMEKTLEKLSRSYVGRQAEDFYTFLKDFYQKESLVCTDFLKINHFGMILHKFYGRYDEKEDQVKHSVRYRNFMGNTIIDIDETIQTEAIRYDDELLLLQYTGSIPSDKNWEMFYGEMQRKEIAYTPETDCPKLDKYKGQILLDFTTKEVLEHKLTIEFSLGENYQKKIICHIKEISYDEL
ncbi:MULTISPECIES: hypothetical protein [unclassified Chryseobacterium]|uniref:hypothetical protein n=1 Tax=unclassified Chryseobacterium TaxID=2593645 RepID=UPI00100BB354|nr:MULTISPECIES: hypothetical protein [unclassified Chryseobacterium]RXM50577.1 hypothetical protein BOQ64_17700 [Chryseobacterium sp. CH25]RXM63212.1 hypothetical protein BOQ60_17900 [Chryseobacterium sp. CH1]